ncbi:general substrate transporter [Syncephalis fuscata]|nr:general substrate transporter [Syncephalis fuscata]
MANDRITLDRLGRQNTISIGTMLSALGGIILTIAIHSSILYAGRFIFGVSMGLLWVGCSIYLTEIAPSGSRGAFVACQELLFGFGLLISTLTGFETAENNQYKNEWRTPFIIQVVTSFIIMLCTTYWLPSSPRWIAWSGQMDKAELTLAQLRGPRYPHSMLQNELQLIIRISTKEHEIKTQEKWYTVLASQQFMHAITVLLLRQLCGIAPMIYHTPIFLRQMGFYKDRVEFIVMAGIGITTMLSAPLCVCLVDRVGRRKILAIGAALMSMAHGAVLTLAIIHQTNIDALWVPYGCLVAICLFFAAFSLSWGPIAWLFAAEILPFRHRASGLSMAGAAYWTLDVAIKMLFPFIIEIIGWWIYGVFSMICIFISGWVWTKLYETKQRSLESITRHYATEF